MSSIKPKKKPQITQERLEKVLKKRKTWKKLPECYIVGIRGYFLRTMGDETKNDRGIYDDALIVVGPGIFLTYKANLDPSRGREGEGRGSKKGMATLKEGVWKFKLGIHGISKPKNRQYPALVQAEKVTVMRDAKKSVKEAYEYEGRLVYDDSGFFGINIHKGGFNTTSSEGCLTVYPTYWESYYATVEALVKDLKLKTIEAAIFSNDGSVA